MVGLQPVPGAAPQGPEEGGLGDMAPGVVARVQGLVVAEAGDALVGQVQGVVDLQAAGPQAAADLGQGAQAAEVAVEPARPGVVAGVVLGAVVVPEAEVVAAGAVVDQPQVLPLLPGAADGRPELAGAEGAAGGAQPGADLVAEGAGPHVDDPAEAVAAEAGRHRPPVDLDAGQAADGQAAQVDAAARGPVEGHPVEEDPHLLRGGAADGEGAEAAQPAVAAHVHARGAVEGLRKIRPRGAPAVEGDRFHEGGHRLAPGVAAGADHHLVHQQGEGLQAPLDGGEAVAGAQTGLQRLVSQAPHAQVPGAGGQVLEAEGPGRIAAGGMDRARGGAHGQEGAGHGAPRVTVDEPALQHAGQQRRRLGQLQGQQQNPQGHEKTRPRSRAGRGAVSGHR